MPDIASPYVEIDGVMHLDQSATPDTPDTGKSLIFTKADGVYVIDDEGNVTGPLVEATSTVTTDYICIIDQKAQNTDAGTFTLGAWRTRELNTELSDTGGHASVASNQITLAAGTYVARISCPAYAVASHQARLYDITNTALLLTGTSEYAVAASSGYNRSFIYGKFTLAGSTVVEVQHQGTATKTTNGLGVKSNFGVEVYTVAEFWKVA